MAGPEPLYIETMHDQGFVYKLEERYLHENILLDRKDLGEVSLTDLVNTGSEMFICGQDRVGVVRGALSFAKSKGYHYCRLPEQTPIVRIESRETQLIIVTYFIDKKRSERKF